MAAEVMIMAMVKVTGDVRRINSRKDGKPYGFQTCGLQDGNGFFEKFDRMIAFERDEKPLPPGDYDLGNFRPFIDARGNLRVGFDLIPAKAAKAA